MSKTHAQTVWHVRKQAGFLFFFETGCLLCSPAGHKTGDLLASAFWNSKGIPTTPADEQSFE
jgi:hypothetical protein